MLGRLCKWAAKHGLLSLIAFPLNEPSTVSSPFLPIPFSTGPKLHSKRFSTAASALDGCVYVTGGYDGSYLQVTRGSLPSTLSMRHPACSWPTLNHKTASCQLLVVRLGAAPCQL